MALNSLRRCLLRPLSRRAADLLRQGQLPDALDLEVFRIDPDCFHRHFQVFNDLDRINGIACQDFHVEEVEPERLPAVITTLRTYPHQHDPELEDLLDRMWGLCHRAHAAGLPAFFVL